MAAAPAPAPAPGAQKTPEPLPEEVLHALREDYFFTPSVVSVVLSALGNKHGLSELIVPERWKAEYSASVQCVEQHCLITAAVIWATTCVRAGVKSSNILCAANNLRIAKHLMDTAGEVLERLDSYKLKKATLKRRIYICDKTTLQFEAAAMNDSSSCRGLRADAIFAYMDSIPQTEFGNIIVPMAVLADVPCILIGESTWLAELKLQSGAPFATHYNISDHATPETAIAAAAATPAKPPTAPHLKSA